MIKIYCYERPGIFDIVFVDPDFGAISIEEYRIDGEYIREYWRDLKQYESSHLGKYIKTFVGDL